jgi:hypothetical protein
VGGKLLAVRMAGREEVSDVGGGRVVVIFGAPVELERAPDALTGLT